MCGIAGFTNPAPDARRILAEMNAALGHRGPDGNGVFVDDNIAMGHTRLAIIDASGGAQPRVDKASRDALVFNGEIYGYRALAAELRSLGVSPHDRSDTEVLFQLIRREGVRRGRLSELTACSPLPFATARPARSTWSVIVLAKNRFITA